MSDHKNAKGPDQVDALDAILNTYDLSSMRVPARAEAKAKLSALLVDAERKGYARGAEYAVNELKKQLEKQREA